MSEISKFMNIDWSSISKVLGIEQGNISKLNGIDAPLVVVGGDRGVFGGGYNTNPLNIIDYITISTPGGATDFGDLTLARNGLGATSNGISDRGVFAAGSPGPTNIIDYITISTPGDAIDFGDLTLARSSHPGACSNAG